MNLTDDAKAILLLCGSFGDRGTSAKPLSAREYHDLAVWLHQRNLTPAALLEPEGWRRLDEAQSPVEVERVRDLLGRGAAMAMAVERWLNKGLWVLCRSDEAYPGRLKRELRALTPPILYGAGPVGLLGAGGLGVVGSREASEPALAVARALGEAAAQCGVVLVSGGARGVDQAAADGALEAGGRSVAVLSNDLLRTACSQPARDRVREGRLVLVSPYHPEVGFSVGQAMGRNKIVYALADAVVVACTDVGRGGTWAGAVEALGLWPRDRVSVWVGPGAPETNRRLVEEGATPLTYRGETREWLAFVTEHCGRSSGDESKVVATVKEPPAADEPAEVAPMQATRAGRGGTPQGRPWEAIRHELLDALRVPRSAKDLARLLRVPPAQVNTWLERLTEEGRVEVERRGRSKRWKVREKGLF